MNLAFDYFRHKLRWPASDTPPWAEKVERWYQLDAASFALADAYWSFRHQLEHPPGWLLLASPGASNVTDAQFAAAPSPAKFVHTLPNIRAVSLLQLMDWTGQILCLQNDPHTVVSALGEAFGLAQLERCRVWVAGARPMGAEWIAEFYTVGVDGHFRVRPRSPGVKLSTRDAEWFEWLDGSARKIVADGYEIIKK